MSATSSWQVIGAVTRVELLRLVRDRVGLFFTVALPFMIILLVGITVAGGDDEGFDVGLVSAGEGPVADALVERLDEAFDLSTFADRPALEEALRAGAPTVGVVIPEGLDAQLAAGEHVHLAVLTDPSAGPTGVNVAAAVDAAARAEGVVVAAARFAADETGQPLDQALALVRTVRGGEGEAVEVVTLTSAEEDPVADLPLGFDYTAPRNLVLFTFITSLAMSGAIIQMRQLGIAKRSLAAPAPPRAVLAGVAAARFATALFQSLVIVVGGVLLFGVDWGDPLGATALVFAFALVGTGAGMLAGTLFRTPEQSGAVGPPVGIALGMLGGCMWPLEIVPPAMRTVGHFLPHAWAVDGFTDLIGRGASFSAVLPEVGVLLGFAAGLLTLATLRVQRTLAA